MIYGKLTAKSQTTVPRAVRKALGLQPGDDIAWEVDAAGARLVRVDPFVEAFPLANLTAFTEWADELDAAYDTL